MSRTFTTENLASLFDAFNRHDIAAIMAHFAEDCVFLTAAGPHAFGDRIEGKAAVARAFEAVWTAMPDVRWDDHRHFLSADGSRGVSEWIFRATDRDGNRIEQWGVDLFRIRDGLIIEKSALRKQRTGNAAR